MTLFDWLRDVPEAADISADDLFDALANARRRHAIATVAEMDDGDELTLDDLARDIAFIENDHERMKDVTSQERKRVYICMYQSHLPKLDRTGIVEWDSRANTIQRTPLTGGVRRLMERAEERVASGEMGVSA